MIAVLTDRDRWVEVEGSAVSEVWAVTRSLPVDRGLWTVTHRPSGLSIMQRAEGSRARTEGLANKIAAAFPQLNIADTSALRAVRDYISRELS